MLARLHAPVYASRLAHLTRALHPPLKRAGCRSLLDVGCGNGTLAHTLAQQDPTLRVAGLERAPRGGEPIPVTAYDGGAFPFDDDAVDAVLLADVLHHDPDPVAVLREAARVAAKIVVVKDHSPRPGAAGRLLDTPRIGLMDWLANAPYGVKCLYDYPEAAGWRRRFDDAGLRLLEEDTALQLYPRPHRWVFTPGLQYLAVCAPVTGPSTAAADPADTGPQ